MGVSLALSGLLLPPLGVVGFPLGGVGFSLLGGGASSSPGLTSRPMGRAFDPWLKAQSSIAAELRQWPSKELR